MNKKIIKKDESKKIDNNESEQIVKKNTTNFKSDSYPQRNDKPFYGQNRYVRRKKFCKLCASGVEHVDYKDIELLSKYLNHNMKIASRKQTSACASHQRRISNAIKRARIVALIHCVKD